MKDVKLAAMGSGGDEPETSLLVSFLVRHVLLIQGSKIYSKPFFLNWAIVTERWDDGTGSKASMVSQGL